ncbi:MAG TPA: aldolase/citrate lyase family protein [bacterium]|nr:aldolase/citrate lyase family protein [bacterium]
MSQLFNAGDDNPKNRGDCFVELSKNADKNRIKIESKVKTFFGDSIDRLAVKMLDFYGIEDAKLTIHDRGALEYVLAARIETVIKKAYQIDKGYLPEFNQDNHYAIEKEKKRRTRLYLPGNTPKFMINAGIHEPDAIILDLEDSVAPDKKMDARILVRNALRANDFLGTEKTVRINQLPAGLEDLDYIVPHHVHTILIPKCQTPQEIKEIENRISKIDGEYRNDPIYLLPIIEDPKGLMNAYEIAKASENVVALAIGLEDYTASLGVKRTKEGKETEFAKNFLVNAAKAAGIQPLDSVFSDVSDQEGLRKFVNQAKDMGFVGMGCIHPRQVKVIHEEFAPEEEEIKYAQRVVLAYEEAEKKGLSAVALDSKMIDPPVVKRAFHIIDLALDNRQIDENWRANYEN